MDAIKNAVSAAKKVKRSFSRRNETVVVVMDRGSRFCECEAKEYNEFLEMKKWRMKLLEEKLQASDNFSEASSPTGVFASTPRTSVETPGGKPFFPKTDSCCSAMISPHSSFGRDIIDHCEHMNGKVNLEESSISFHARPPSYPNLSSACDEGYSTSSQNGWPLSYGTRSISSPPSESFDDAYDTSSKSGTITKKEQEELRHLLKTFEDTTSSAESDNDDADREIDVGRVEIQSMDVMCTKSELTQSSSVLIPEELIKDFHALVHADDTLIISISRGNFIVKCNSMLRYFDENSLKLNFSKSSYFILNPKPIDRKTNLQLDGGMLKYKSVQIYLGVYVTDCGVLKHDVTKFIREKRSNVLFKFTNFCNKNFLAPLGVKLS